MSNTSDQVSYLKVLLFLGLGIPVIMCMVLSLFNGLISLAFYEPADSSVPDSLDNPYRDSDMDFVYEIGNYAWMVMGSLVVLGLVWMSVSKLRGVSLSEMFYDRADENKQLVEGWEWALCEGVISNGELSTLDSETLQSRIDAANPFSVELTNIELALTVLYVGSEPDDGRLEKLLTYRRLLREQPGALMMVQVLASTTDEVLDRAASAIRIVTPLNKG